jgi:hypothetical protein
MSPWKRRLAAGLVALLGAGALTVRAADDAASASAWDRFMAFTHAQKDTAVDEGRKLIAASDRQMAEMKAQGKASGKEAQAAWKASMAELEAKQRATKAELDKLTGASANAWDATKSGFAGAYRDLHDAYKKATGSGKP